MSEATAPQAPDVVVLILNWNGLADTFACVDALLQTQGAAFRAIVVDNGSDGDDFAQLRARYEQDSRVEVRANAENLGFARGMNALLAELLQRDEAKPEFVALLNNDAIPEPDWLAQLLATAQKSGAGAVASRMIRYDDPDCLDNAGHVFLNTGEVLPRGAGQSPDVFSEPADVVGACAGACLYRLDMLEQIGLFDEFFDTGYEDAELGLRAMLAGFRQVYAPGAVVRHRVGASIDKIRDRDYAVRLQVNINYTYLKLMPVPVMLWNLPWILLKTCALLIVPLFTLRWRLLQVQWLALVRSFGVLGKALQSRRRMPQRTMVLTRIIGSQRFFLGLYWRYFRRFVLARERTIFER